MSIVDEINKDLAELGEAGGETIEEAMDKLGDEIVKTKGEADANKLPEVTADDNGDVLTVVEGEWAKAAISSQAIKLTSAKTSNNHMPLTIDYNELVNLVTTKVVEIYDTKTKTNYTFGCIDGNGNVNFFAKVLLAVSPLEFLVTRLQYNGTSMQEGMVTEHTLKTA